jgi:hypothetical protein
MPRSGRALYPAEVRRQMVELVRAGRSAAELATERGDAPVGRMQGATTSRSRATARRSDAADGPPPRASRPRRFFTGSEWCRDAGRRRAVGLRLDGAREP